MRKVTAYSTQGGKKVYDTNATTWGELKSLVSQDYDLSNLKAAENVNKTTLENSDAVLPEGNFTLFLRPNKTKSGSDLDSVNFLGLREIVGKDRKKAEYLKNKYLVNSYRDLTTSQLREGLKEYSEANEIVVNNSSTNPIKNIYLNLEEIEAKTGDEEILGRIEIIRAETISLEKALDNSNNEDNTSNENLQAELEEFDSEDGYSDEELQAELEEFDNF